MIKRPRKYLLALSVLTSATLMLLSVRADLKMRKGHDDDNHGSGGAIPLATGQFITPTAMTDAVQQYLNPGLSAYPNFIAGEAVRSQLSPDGTTLAIITAGQNSLYKADGTVDMDNSKQFIFLYDVTGANEAKPQLKQV